MIKGLFFVFAVFFTALAQAATICDIASVVAMKSELEARYATVNRSKSLVDKWEKETAGIKLQEVKSDVKQALVNMSITLTSNYNADLADLNDLRVMAQKLVESQKDCIVSKY